jgi:hypothetical protein
MVAVSAAKLGQKRQWNGTIPLNFVKLLAIHVLVAKQQCSLTSLL